jgi:hypothetical protein
MYKTFWSVPANFKQLITINCYVFSKYFPLCYILMSEKSQNSYEQAFKKVVELTKI